MIWRNSTARGSTGFHKEEKPVEQPNLTKLGKFLCLILRHKPEVIGITVDRHGWADVDELIRGVNRKYPFDRELLEEIVRTDAKQRYTFDEDGTKIRANQGHSLPVDLELAPLEPPPVLWHGSAERFRTSILEQGLLPQSRHQVHLSSDYETALPLSFRCRAVKCTETVSCSTAPKTACG